MGWIAGNNQGVFLDADLQDWIQVPVQEDFVLYQHLFQQFRLPNNQWNYDAADKNIIFTARSEGEILLDEVGLGAVEIKHFLNPYKLYDFFLLEQWLGNHDWKERVSIFSGRKLQLVFREGNVQWSRFLEEPFRMNDLGQFILKNGRKNQLLEVHQTFFTRLNHRLEEKIFNGYTEFQSTTGISVNKRERLAALFILERIEKLRLFSENKIKKL